MNAADPDVANVGETVAVAWRPRPDGARLTYLDRVDGADAVYDYRPGIDASERVVAFDGRIGGRFGDVDWGPDGDRLAYVRDGRVRVYDAVADAESTPLPGDAFEAAPRFSPGGDRLAVRSDRDGHGVDVYVVDLDADADGAGAPTRVTTGASPVDDRRWAAAWAPDGDRLAYVAAHGRGDDVHVTALSDGTDERLTRGLCVSTTPAWGPDGDRLAFLATRLAEPWYRHHDDLHVIDVATGRAETFRVGGSHQYFQQRPLWAPDGSRLFYPVRDRGRQHVEALVVDDGDARGVPTRVTTHDGVFGAGPVTLSPDGSTIAYPYAAVDAPAHPRTLSTRGGTAATVRAPDAPDGVVVPERVTVASFDGAYVAGSLYLPEGASAGDPVPGLVQCHGGGHFQFGDGWHPTEAHLAANGFAVLAIDFRGSGGYGRPFQALSMGDWGGGQVRDVREAAGFLRDHPATTDEVGVYGASWGGMLTVHAITQFPETFDAAVEWYGIVDQAAGYEAADRLGRLLRERDLGGTPDEVPEAYRAASTDWRLDRIEAPLAVLHGADDRRVPVVNAERLRDALADRDLPSEVTIYEGEGHGFREAATRRDALDRTRAWFERHLG